MKIEKYEFEGIRPLQNFVLVTPVFKTDVVKCGEIELILDTSWKPDEHAPIVQRVVKAPRKLVFGRKKAFYEVKDDMGKLKETVPINKPLAHSMPWETTMDLKPDDIVWCDFVKIAQAIKSNRFIECEGKHYFLVPYSDIYLKKRDEGITMLNGWVLVAPIKEKKMEAQMNLEKAGLVFPGIQITNNNKRELGIGDLLGVVKYIGEPIYKYLEGKPDTDEVGEGDTVVLKLPFNRRLESSSHPFFSDEELIVTRRSRIIGKLEERLF